MYGKTTPTKITLRAMSKISVRLPDEMIEAIGEIMDQYNLRNRSRLVRSALREYLLDAPEEDLPVWVVKEMEHTRIVEENNWLARAANFEQRSYEKLRGMLLDENGEEKKFPPSPEKVERAYVESWRREIDREVPEEWQDEYHDHIDAIMAWYSAHHPEPTEEAEKDWDEMVEQVALFGRMVRWDMAVEYAERMEKNGHIEESTRLVDAAREKTEEPYTEIRNQ